MNPKAIILFAVLAAVGILVLQSGCSDDPTQPAVGTVHIVCSPDTLLAPWTLAGPNGHLENGYGVSGLTNMPTGEYTLTWNEVADWVTPAPATITQTLPAGGEVTFTGVYPLKDGTITINPDPDELDAGWTLTGPSQDEQTGQGDVNLEGMPPGDYEIVWSDVSEWNSPPDSRQTLPPDSHVTFSGTYMQQTGSIIVDPSPGTATWTLTGPGGYSNTRTDTYFCYNHMAIGSYTITWADPNGWVPPPDETLILTEGNVILFDGTFVVGTGVIVIDPQPAEVADIAPWTLEVPGPDITGTGLTTLDDMPLIRYKIIWGVVEGWRKPANEYLNLWENQPITFTGTYYCPEFVPIPAGTFTMGSPENEMGRESWETQHSVTLTHPFFIQSTEVTNQQYIELAQWAVDNGYATATPSSVSDKLDGSDVELLDLESFFGEIQYANGTFSLRHFNSWDNPCDHVVKLSWYGAAAYCDWLSLYEGLERAYDHSDWSCNNGDPYNAEGYRLPTEAEWEYACRAGSTTAFANGEITNVECADPVLDLIGWYCGDAFGENGWTISMARKIPNNWDLYDMHGNAQEWCNDWWNTGVDYSPDPVTNPTGEVAGTWRVARGGYYSSRARDVRCASRYGEDPAISDSYRFGFRPARTDN